MFLPEIEKRRYAWQAAVTSVPDLKNYVQAGEGSYVEAVMYPSTYLPRCKVGKNSHVKLSGDPEATTIFLGDYADVNVKCLGRYSKDFITISGKECCNVFLENTLPIPDNMNLPAFIHADFEPDRIDNRQQSIFTGFKLIGESFTVKIQESCQYNNRHLNILLYSHRGDLSFYMGDRLVCKLKPGLRFDYSYWDGAYKYGMTTEDYLYKLLRKYFFDICKNQQKKSQSCRSVAA